MELVEGVHEMLEDMADAMLTESLVGVWSHEDKRDILTRWKHQRNYEREILLATPERATRQGMYGRARNEAKPELNARDGEAGMHRQSHHPLFAHWVEFGYL